MWIPKQASKVGLLRNLLSKADFGRKGLSLYIIPMEQRLCSIDLDG